MTQSREWQSLVPRPSLWLLVQNSSHLLAPCFPPHQCVLHWAYPVLYVLPSPFLDLSLVHGPGLRGSPLEPETLLRQYTRTLPEGPFSCRPASGACLIMARDHIQSPTSKALGTYLTVLFAILIAHWLFLHTLNRSYSGHGSGLSCWVLRGA